MATPSSLRLIAFGFEGATIGSLLRCGVEVPLWVVARLPRNTPAGFSGRLIPSEDVAFSTSKENRNVAIDASSRIELKEKYFELFRRHFERKHRNLLRRSLGWNDLDNYFQHALSNYVSAFADSGASVVVFSNFPHLGADIAALAAAQHIGLRTFVCHQSQFPGRFWICSKIEDFGAFAASVNETNALTLPETPKAPFYMKARSRYVRPLVPAVSLGLDLLKVFFRVAVLQPLWRKGALSRPLNRISAKLSAGALKRKSPIAESGVGLSKSDRRTIYFPLHLQPELTTDTLGGDFADQLLALEHLSNALGEETRLLVKENPKQSRLLRGPSFMRRFKALKNVELLAQSVSSFEAINHAAAVATITGTAGWEGLQMGKPVILFGRAWYSSLPGVIAWDDPELIQKVDSFVFDRVALEEGFARLSQKGYTGVVDSHYLKIVTSDQGRSWPEVTARSILSHIKGSEGRLL